MPKIINAAVNGCYIVLFLGIVLLFYLSVKKCFWDGKRKKIAVFLLSLLFNPFTAMAFAIGITFFTGTESIELFYIRVLRDIPSPFVLSLGTGLIFIVSFMVFSVLNTWAFGKWLGVKNFSSFLFLYMMLDAIYVLEEVRSVGNGNFFDNSYMRNVIDFIGTSVIFIAMLCFYYLDVKPFSALAQIKVKVKWKTFIIPPILFILIYGVFGWILENYDDEELIISVYSFTSIIVYLFIWAFNVIIKNLSATNEAVIAKDEALQAKDEVKTLSVEVMEALAHTIDAKDEYTRGHSVRVAKYSRMLAEKLNLSADECENVYYMALLHDIGKIGVPNEIINSPTKLTDDEYAVIKTHPGTGFGILAEIKSRPDLSIGARWHHERYDGKGYPDGKAGEEIPFYARIIAVADSYDAMTSNRSYRNYLSQETVRSELQKNSGAQFDPKVVECMLAIMDEDKEYQLHE